MAALGFSLKIQQQAQPPLRRAESEQATLAPGTGLLRAERCDGRRAPSAPRPRAVGQVTTQGLHLPGAGQVSELS